MTTQWLERPGGRLAYEQIGDGPLILCSPGMGDLRSTYDDMAAALAADGFRVVTTDLRGHGESSVGWPDHSVAAVAGDLLALNEHLGGHAVLIGNSYSGSAAVVAAAQQPDAFAAIVLSGAFVRNHPPGLAGRITLRLLRLPGIGRRLFVAGGWPSFFGPSKPAHFAERKAELARNLAEKGRYAALTAMMTTPGGHSGTEPLLGKVTVPALVVMGTADPDFPDPAAEARFTADALGGPAEVLMVEGAGHYPQDQAPELVAAAVAKLARA